MDKNEILFDENVKSCEAPPAALNIDFLNFEKIKNYKITKNNNFIIYSKSQNSIKNKLIIDISHETLKSLEKDILLDIITYINNYCGIYLISNNINFNKSKLEIKKSKINTNEYSMMLKNNRVNNKIKSEISNEFHCSNLNRYFKLNEASQTHFKDTHKYYINGKNNQNDIDIIINDNDEIKNKEVKRANKLKLLFDQMEKEEKEKARNYKILKKREKEIIKKENELKLREEELKRREEEEIKKREEEQKKIEKEIKRIEELKKIEKLQEEEKKKQEELNRINDIKKQYQAESNQDVYYECYLDKKRFKNEKEYVYHFSKYHNNDYPFYCDLCNKGFYSFQAIENHNFSKNH